MAIGIVAEFNPFHNGHKYLIANAKKHNEKIIAVMSGSWVQRGEPSITDKWSRARAALENGVDLVIELPVVFSLNTAQSFAMGAVSTLAATGAVTTLTFGSECGSSETLLSAAEKLLNESDAVSLKIKQSISSGMSYAAARCAAYNTILPQGLLSSPNDILALEYIQAINKLKLNFDVHAIKRYGVPHDGNISQNIASASKIRQIITHGGRAEEYMPNSYFAVYDKSALDSAVIAKLRTVGADYLKTINDVNEGLENRFIKAAALSETVDELCMNVKSKRYTLSRIRRIAYSALLGITKKQYKPSYIRVLGMNGRGKEILKQMKTTAVLPVIIKAADYRGDEIFSLNSRAEDIFALCAPTREQKRGGRDITQSPVVL